MAKKKSVLTLNDVAPEPRSKLVLVIVGSCKMCGNPIYGPELVESGVTPEVRRSCSCGTGPRYQTKFDPAFIFPLS